MKIKKSLAWRRFFKCIKALRESRVSMAFYVSRKQRVVFSAFVRFFKIKKLKSVVNESSSILAKVIAWKRFASAKKVRKELVKQKKIAMQFKVNCLLQKSLAVLREFAKGANVKRKLAEKFNESISLMSLVKCFKVLKDRVDYLASQRIQRRRLERRINQRLRARLFSLWKTKAEILLSERTREKERY